MENDGTISQAFSEVYSILENLETNLYNRIPKGFIKLVENNRDLRI